MARERPRHCTFCGERIPDGREDCPDCAAGERLASAPTRDAAPPSLTDLLRLHDGGGNSLHECVPCGRLLEAQDVGGRLVTPRFCPSCGGRLESILGRELDGYRIDEAVSHGGFGFVYLASNVTQPKMKAVLKVLRPELAYRRPELVRVFLEEARLTEEIGQTCWNVVRVFNVRETPWPCFFMEYLRGVTLDAALEARGEEFIPIEECKGHLRGIARALAATHAHGRVHRDLKPLNIMLLQTGEFSSREDRVKLLDFGLSMKIASAKAGVRRTDHSGTGISALLREMDSPIMTAGTPDYMPPEAFDGINEFGGDVYSFGVTAYELLTGQRPWSDPGPDSERYFYWREMHKNTPPRSLRELRPDTPGWLARLVMRCLEKDPTRRIGTADELLERLREPVSRWVWAVGAVALVLLVLLARFALTPPHRVAVRQWTVAGETATDPLELWVRDASDLAERRVAASFETDTPLEDCDFNVVRSDDGETVEGIAVRAADGALEVSFASTSELLGRSYRLEGSGPGITLRGDFHVRADPTPPVIAPLELQASAAAAVPLAGEERVRPDRARLLAAIDEENLDHSSVLLVLEDTASPSRRFEMAPDASAGDAGARWSFPLASEKVSLPEGAYTAHVVARDRAGNDSASSAVAIHIDRSVACRVLEPDEPTFVAGGRVYYRFTADEPLADVRLDAADVRRVEIHRDRGFTSSRDLARRARALEPVSPRALRSGERFLLAFSIADSGDHVEDVLVASDTAVPANTRTLRLRRPPVTDAAAVAVERVVLEPEGGAPPVVVEGQPLRESFAAVPADGVARVRAPRPLPSGRLLRLRVRWNSNVEFHRGICELDTGELVSYVADDREPEIAFNDLRLTRNGRTVLPLVLYTPLERPLRLDVELETDLEPPRAQSLAVTHVKQWSVVESWKDVSVELRATEALERATARILDAEIPGTASADRRAWRFDLSGLPIVEGQHALHVELVDHAGNRGAAEPTTLAVNTGAPRVTPRFSSPGRRGTMAAHIDDAIGLQILDGNGVDLSGVRASLARDGGGDAVPLTITGPTGDGEYAVAIPAGFPDDSIATLEVSVGDTLGARFDGRWRFSFKPLVRWKERVDDWRGLEWVRVDRPGRQPFYVSRYEIPNEVWRRELSGRAKALRARPPRYWSTPSTPPRHRRDASDEGRVDGARFPVVGVSGEDAEEFARLVFGGRLPSFAEWLLAARLESAPDSRHPWTDAKLGRLLCNAYEAWEVAGSPYATHRFRFLESAAQLVKCHAVEVDFDPLANVDAETRARLVASGYDGALPHVAGNVGEIVTRDGAFWVAGGDYDTDYRTLSIAEPIRFTGPSVKTGFRVVIDLDEDPPADFRAAVAER